MQLARVLVTRPDGLYGESTPDYAAMLTSLKFSSGRCAQRYRITETRIADRSTNIEVDNAVVENLRDDLGGHEILEEKDVDNDIQGDHPHVSSVIVPSCRAER